MLCYHHYSQSCCLLFYPEILKYDKQLDMHKAILYHVVSTLFHVATSLRGHLNNSADP